MKITINQPVLAIMDTVNYGIELTPEECFLLAGDIENFLQTNKSIVCKLEVQK